MLLGLCSCERAATAPSAELMELLQQRDYPGAVAFAESGLRQATRGSETYRDHWIVRTEAWMHIAPRRATEALASELSIETRWLQPEDVLYLGARWKQIGRFEECHGALHLAMQSWPEDESIRMAYEDAALELRGRRWWHDCSPSRAGFGCICCY